MRPQRTCMFLSVFTQRTFFSLLFLSVLVFNVAAAHAAQIFLKPDIEYSPLWSTGSIEVNFVPDEQKCRAAFGSNWKTECSAWLGKSGTVPKGIVAEGWPEGEWMWSSSQRLTFTPNKSWKSSTSYTVDVSKVPLPARVTLTATTSGFTSLPRSAQLDKPQIWIDPSRKFEHAISFSMTFTESMNKEARQALEQHASIVPKQNSGLTLGKAQWVWLDDNTRAVVNARILTMPKKKSIATLTLPGVRPLWRENNRWHFPDRDAVKEMSVSGTDTIFNLKRARLEAYENKALQMEQHIIFSFTQRVPAEELLKNLTILELPLKRDKENILPSNWKDGKISPQNMQNSRKLQPQLVKLPDENEDFIRFRIDTTPGHYILWSINKDFGPTNSKGLKTTLGRNTESIEFISDGSPRLNFLQSGNVLSQQSDIAVVSEYVDSIRWTAYRFRDDSLALPFITSLDDSIEDSQGNATSVVMRGEIPLAVKSANAKGYTSSPVFSTLSSKKIFGTEKGDLKPGLIYLKLEGVKKGEVVTEANRILMYSNMAMVIKKLPSGKTEAYVSSLTEGKALEDVRVQILGYNGIALVEAKTDAGGKATFPDTSHFTKEKAPTAIVARNNDFGNETDMLWMSLDDHGRNVNLSNFADLNGRQSSANTLNAFVFAERGYFRPGEELRFGVLLRANDWKLLPQDMPLLATVYDEVGRRVHQQAFKAAENIHSFTWKIPESAMTGRYRMSISTPKENNTPGLVLGSATARIEMFVPDTLRIRTDLVNTAASSGDALSTKGWLVTSDKQGTTALRVKLDTLFGQVAAGRRVTAVMKLHPATLHFSGFEDYTFQDTSPFFAKGSDPITRPLTPSTSDAKGLAVLPLDFTQWRFGTLQCVINTEGFEPGGGRAVRQEKRFLLSPLPFMLGYKAGEGADNRNFIMKGSTAKLQFQAIDSMVKPVNPGQLVFAIARRNTVTSLVSDSRGVYTYAETPVDTPISQGEVQMSAEGQLVWDIPTQEVGDYILTVKTPATGNNKETKLAHIPFSIVGNDDLRPALLSGSNLPKAHLHLKTDKVNYVGGEAAKLMLTTPYEGMALISLERDTVVAHKWVKLPMGSSMHEIDIPENFSGRGYIQVLMGRSPESESIFLQPQSVAMASIAVNTAKREQKLAITAPEKVLPGKTLSVHIKNTQGTPTKALLFAVDEGILQLSRYKTPNPLQYLLLDRALEVRTAQLFDRLMAGDKKLMQRISAFGGGVGEDAFAGMLGNFQNPFKRKNEPPMTWWSGVVDIPAEGLNVEIPIPDYFNGSLRLMSVVNNEAGVGNGQARVFVQDEQVLTPQLPVMASLGDKFEGGLAIANTTDNPVTLKLALALDESSGAKGLRFANFPQSVALAAKEEKLLPVDIMAGQEPGEAVLRFTVEDEKGVVRTRKTSMSIRPAVLPRYSQQSMVVNQSADLFTKRSLLGFDAKTSIAVSPVPIPLLQSALSFLEYYPFDCVEQTISKAFPLVALVNTPLGQELAKTAAYLNTKNMEESLQNAQNVLLAAFKPYNGISMWADRNDVDLFLTAYAADYILNLNDANLPTPPGMLPQLFNTLERSINESPRTVNSLRALSYAAWVLARAGYVVSNQLELNENYIKRESLTKGDVYNTLMAGAYAALYMQEEAQNHLSMVSGDKPKSWEVHDGMFDTLARYGLHARVLAKHFPKEFEKSVAFLQNSMLEGLNKSHATMGASMAALGLLEIVKYGAEQDQDLQGLQLACNGYVDGYKQSASPVAQMFPNLHVLNAPVCTNFAVRMSTEKKLFAHIQSYGFDTKVPTKSLEEHLRVKRSMTKSDGTAFTGSVTQGEVLRVDVDVNLKFSGSADVVVVDLIPGGFELVLDHKDDTRPSSSMSLRRDEDRLIVFLEAESDVKRITYHIRAISQGEFALPLTQAEGLFDRTLQAHTAGGKKVRVLAP